MRLTFEDNNLVNNIENPSLEDVKAVLGHLDPILRPYVIFVSDDDNFIQCAGSLGNLAVEIRIYNLGAFKHFIVGKKNLSKVWHTINCKVGPIRVLGNEDLEIKDAIELFEYFYIKNDIPLGYNKRNVTKNFK
jgi:hypothetical protein